MREKLILEVPKGIKYFSDYEEQGFHLEDFPYILDKQIPGCGFTTWVLKNSQNVILASPRKMLMINKKSQMDEEKVPVFLVNISNENYVDKDLNKSTNNDSQENVPSVKDWKELKHNLGLYISERHFDKRPIKIIVTYDSYRKVREILEEARLFDSFYTVVDEFQSIFTDSRFKSDTEMEFIENLKSVQKVCYVSATPMMEEYLDLIDYFRDLPYQSLDWGALEPDRISKPELDVRSLKSVNTAIKPIIEAYRAGRFEHRLQPDGSGDVTSKEAVFYINSVSNIIGIINTCKLMPEEVCILCSNTSYNQKRISTRLDKKKQGIEYKIEDVPTRNKPRKMFTFCTRTVYLGADFYSPCARSFIISDANIETLAVDITLDLPQILGRQRLDENPWRNSAVLYVRPPMKFKGTTEEEFNAWVEKKMKETKDLLLSYESSPDEAKFSVANIYEREAKGNNYKYNYVSVNKHAGKQPTPVFNSLVAIAEKRAFDIQKKDYADRFVTNNRIREAGINITTELSFNVQYVLRNFDRFSSSKDKLKYLCTQQDVVLSQKEWNQLFSEIDDSYRNYYIGLGADRCKALGYDFSRLQREYEVKFFDTDLVRGELVAAFPVGLRISSSEAKDKLRELYRKLGYKKNPKATDLETYFILKDTKIKDPIEGKLVRAYEILGLR